MLPGPPMNAGNGCAPIPFEWTDDNTLSKDGSRTVRWATSGSHNGSTK